MICLKTSLMMYNTKIQFSEIFPVFIPQLNILLFLIYILYKYKLQYVTNELADKPTKLVKTSPFYIYTRFLY